MGVESPLKKNKKKKTTKNSACVNIAIKTLMQAWDIRIGQVKLKLQRPRKVWTVLPEAHLFGYGLRNLSWMWFKQLYVIN